ncbi:transcriptional regulator with XRE-family HTH domain [Kibdelosporangium banguiense]|uniref:Transcriptional regulator with XRE-family HTH domain n=1 Tax=Kibdelosporangium banguiense TaxID=1365924 RepID=A0ABS4U1P5_9PSEU|nr:Scr1 family TA system antitoxin-like transcriptional regulator [Kibdelosporangium banguiense]MBP2330116.1 transcriptional regulator with XRE-family HTH domain [Kibdelosporangium banguiense]
MSHPRDRAIGAQLRAIRKTQTDLKLEDAAELLQWSPATYSRIETGKRHVTSEEVMAILVAYKVPVAQRDEMVAKAKNNMQPGWWDAPLPGVSPDFGTLASYEAEADRLTDWSPLLVPGLMQTHGYARGYMLQAGGAPQDVEVRWMARFQRQQALRRVRYTGYIGAAALHTRFGTENEFTEQLQHLHVMASAVNTSIRNVRRTQPCCIRSC